MIIPTPNQPIQPARQSTRPAAAIAAAVGSVRLLFADEDGGGFSPKPVVCCCGLTLCRASERGVVIPLFSLEGVQRGPSCAQCTAIAVHACPGLDVADASPPMHWSCRRLIVRARYRGTVPGVLADAPPTAELKRRPRASKTSEGRLSAPFLNEAVKKRYRITSASNEDFVPPL